MGKLGHNPPLGGPDASVREQEAQQKAEGSPGKAGGDGGGGRGVERAGAWARLAYYLARLWDLVDDHI